MEESELHEVLHHTLANVDGKAYRTMMSQIFSQRVSPAIDYTYDSDMLKVCRCLWDACCFSFSCVGLKKKFIWVDSNMFERIAFSLEINLHVSSHLKL